MSSANYIPLTQISPSEYLWSPKAPRNAPLSSYFSRRRAVLALVAVTSVLTLLVFLKISASSRDLDLGNLDGEVPINNDYTPSYIAIPVPDTLPASARPRLRPVRELPAECLDQYYESGELCHDGLGPVPMDIIWTWVNGSDPLFLDTREHAANAYEPDDPYRPIQSNNPSRMFRDHDELRHSIRSVLDNFRPYTKRFRILTSDFDYPADDTEEEIPTQSFPDPGPGYWRLGLQPQWLDPADKTTPEWKDGDIQLSLTHHAHFFEPYNYSIFNSYAIESQFSHLQDVSEIFIYMNDDFYMVSQLTPATFYTHQYGVVLRMQSDMTVSPNLPDEHAKGEWKTMGVSNYLLSKRFGRRDRPYVQHEAKGVSLAIIQEIALMWPDVIAKTASHAFRETEGGDGDFYEMFVFAHFIVERAREALLWTWTVGRVGGIEDSWGAREEERAWIEVGGDWDGERSKEVRVESGVRDTMNHERVKEYLKGSGIEGRLRTDYHFSSLDGYGYNEFGRRGVGGWPGFEPEREEDFGEGKEAAQKKQEKDRERKRRMCTIKRDECFGIKGADGGDPTASEIFKLIAFDKPQCGDCIIVSLLNASGPLGLSAFLPHPDRRSPSSDVEQVYDEAALIPHLPLVDDWHDGQFALRNVMKYAPETSVRTWSMRLLQRYRYVIGGTSSMFERLMSLQQAVDVLNGIDRNTDLVLLCINDDVTQNGEEVSRYFRKWQDKRWKHPAAWEADIHRRRREGGEWIEDEEIDWSEDEGSSEELAGGAAV